MQNDIKCSVILTTMNGSSRGFLEKAINSVLAQTFKDYELLIIDDGSKDDTGNICEKYFYDYRVKYYYQENKGPAAARNRGIRYSVGSYICFLDDDDYYHPSRIEEAIKFIENHPNKKIGMVFNNIYLVKSDGLIYGEQSNKADGNIYEKLLFKNIIDGICSVTIKREVFNEIGLFNEQYLNDEDTELWFRVAKNYDIYSINKKLAYVRSHDNNRLSDNIKNSQYYRLLTYYRLFTQDYDRLKKIENEILFNLYYNYAQKYFQNKQFIDFRNCLKISSVYGKIKFKDRIKHIFSYLPIAIKKY